MPRTTAWCSPWLGAGTGLRGGVSRRLGASRLIDLNIHRGVHPRIGAADVVPSSRSAPTSMQVCVELAQRVVVRIAAELDLPVYLYAEAARRPQRRRLPDIRRGEFEYFAAHIAGDDVGARFGPRRSVRPAPPPSAHDRR